MTYEEAVKEMEQGKAVRLTDSKGTLRIENGGFLECSEFGSTYFVGDVYDHLKKRTDWEVVE